MNATQQRNPDDDGPAISKTGDRVAETSVKIGNQVAETSVETGVWIAEKAADVIDTVLGRRHPEKKN